MEAHSGTASRVEAHSGPSAGRRYDLDWIRIAAFGLLILYHVGMLYVTWDFHVKSVHAGRMLEPLMVLTNPWRLSLLFVVSGAATRFMAAKTTVRALVLSRSGRLLWPLLFGMLVVVPPQAYLEVVERLGFDQGFWRFYAGRYFAFGKPFCPDDCLILPTWNHLWFVAYLWVYTMVLAGLLQTAPGLLARAESWMARHLGGWGLIGWPLAIDLVYRTVLAPRFPENHALFGDWYAHATYFSCFLVGYCLVPRPDIVAATIRLRWPALLLAAGAYLSFLAWRALRLPGQPAPEIFQAWFTLAFAVMQWAMIVAVLGFGRRWLDRDHPARRYLTEAVFPYYIIHQTAIIVAFHFIKPLDLPAWGEAGLVILATVVSCAVGAELVRRIGWLRPFFGLKGPAPTARRVAGYVVG